MERAASKAARGASIDGVTSLMVKGAATGKLIAESIKKASNGGRNGPFGRQSPPALAEQVDDIDERRPVNRLARPLGRDELMGLQ